MRDKIKELENKIERILDHLKIEVSFWKEGVWYTDGGKAKVRYSKDGSIGYGLRGDWDSIYMGVFDKSWREMTNEEITTALTDRCNGLGLFDGEFECLKGSWEDWKDGDGAYIIYNSDDDVFWIGDNAAYEKGKFAKKVEKEFIFKESELAKLESYVQHLEERSVNHYKELILQFLRSKR